MYSIRHATLGDLDALINIGDQLFDNPIKPARASEFLNDPRHHLLIAQDQNKIIGMVSGLNHIHPDKDPEMFINEVSVVDECQNQGIGRELVKRMVKHSKEIGCVAAWVATEHSNSAARKTYTAAGGKEDKESFLLINFIV